MPRLENANSYEWAETPVLFAKARDVVTRELERTKVLRTGMEVLDEEEQPEDFGYDSSGGGQPHQDVQPADQQQLSSSMSFSPPTTSNNVRFNTSSSSPVPRFDHKEVVLGRVLGRGGFGVVKQITAIRLRVPARRVVSGGPLSSLQNSSNVAGNQFGGGTGTGGEPVGSSGSSPRSTGGGARRGGGGGSASGSRSDRLSKTSTGRNGCGSSAMRNASRNISNVGGSSRGSLTSASRMSRRTLSSAGSDGSDMTPREYLARRVYSKKKKKGRYVVKQVDPDLLNQDRVTYLKGVIDIALETYYLASLDHHHILKLRGISSVTPYNLNYFIVLDQLSEILTSRLNQWMHRNRAATGITGLLTGGQRKKKTLLIERLLVVGDIAEALEYMHSKNIVYRDLKPDNIGFDQEGTLKVFDFGLAKELIEDERDHDNPTRFHMTKFTGAIRYMAPEVGLGRSYNLKADVYSWSMLFWYVIALEPPMGMYTPKMFIERVFQRGYRPAVQTKWPRLVCELMRSCWNGNMDRRPNFRYVMSALTRLITQIDPDVAPYTNSLATSERWLLQQKQRQPPPQHQGFDQERRPSQLPREVQELPLPQQQQEHYHEQAREHAIPRSHDEVPPPPPPSAVRREYAMSNTQADDQQLHRYHQNPHPPQYDVHPPHSAYEDDGDDQAPNITCHEDDVREPRRRHRQHPHLAGRQRDEEHVEAGQDKQIMHTRQEHGVHIDSRQMHFQDQFSEPQSKDEPLPQLRQQHGVHSSGGQMQFQNQLMEPQLQDEPVSQSRQNHGAHVNGGQMQFQDRLLQQQQGRQQLYIRPERTGHFDGQMQFQERLLHQPPDHRLLHNSHRQLQQMYEQHQQQPPPSSQPQPQPQPQPQLYLHHYPAPPPQQQYWRQEW